MTDVVDPTQAARHLLDVCTLVDVGYFELLAMRGSVGEDGSRQILGPGEVTDLELGECGYAVDVLWNEETDRLLVRLVASVESNAGEIRVGAEPEYEFEGVTRTDMADEVEEIFVNKVAVMALVPYLRSAVSDLSSRVLGARLIMDVVRPGEIEFSKRLAEL